MARKLISKEGIEEISIKHLICKQILNFQSSNQTRNTKECLKRPKTRFSLASLDIGSVL